MAEFNPFMSKNLAYDDVLIRKYADAFDAETGRGIIAVYEGYPVELCRGIFVGYFHVYSLTHGEGMSTAASDNLRIMIQAICARIMGKK